MAHFAEVDENNIVLRVVVIDDEHEHRGEEFLSKDLGLGGRWLKTSYNTKNGIHYNPDTNSPSENQEKSFRKNYASEGYFYYEELDAFVPPKPEEDGEWFINKDTGLWEEEL